MKNKIRKFLIIHLIVGMPMLIWAAPDITVGSASGAPGTTVPLSISFDPTPAAVTSLQFDLKMPPSLSTGSFTEGPILTGAGKTVSTSFIGGVWRFIIFAVNQTPLASANMLTIQMPINTGAPVGAVNLPISNVIFADMNGLSVGSGTNTAGTLMVTLPSLDLSSLDGKTFQVADNLSFTYAASGVSFDWTFLATSPSGSSASGAPALGNAPLSTTSAPKLNLGQYSLSPGKYMLTVTVSGGGQTQTKSAAITLVAAKSSSSKVAPNPWRIDKHSGQPITFYQIAPNTTIKIFTTSGREVRKLTSTGSSVTWDLKNESGDKAASGIYLYLMTDDQGDKVKGKFAIIK